MASHSKRRRLSANVRSPLRDMHHSHPTRSAVKGKGKVTQLLGFNDDDQDEEQVERAPRRQSLDASGVNYAVRGMDDVDDDDDGLPLGASAADEHDDDEEQCAVCLSVIINKTVVSPCMHGQFCWGCIKAWSDQSRKCPLCLGPIQNLLHNIRSANDYQTFHLLPLASPSSSATTAQEDYLTAYPPSSRITRRTLPRHALYGRRGVKASAAAREEAQSENWREQREERALERRRYIYREGLFAKHIASNRYTGFKPFTPQRFSADAELKARVIKFVRRELQVFPTVDVTFLTTYLVSICSQFDLRSSAAIRLISDFLSPEDAEHLAHEIVTFARSPFVTLEGYDRVVQYGRPERSGVSEPPPTTISAEVRRRTAAEPARIERERLERDRERERLIRERTRYAILPPELPPPSLYEDSRWGAVRQRRERKLSDIEREKRGPTSEWTLSRFARPPQRRPRGSQRDSGDSIRENYNGGRGYRRDSHSRSRSRERRPDLLDSPMRSSENRTRSMTRSASPRSDRSSFRTPPRREQRSASPASVRTSESNAKSRSPSRSPLLHRQIQHEIAGPTDGGEDDDYDDLPISLLGNSPPRQWSASASASRVASEAPASPHSTSAVGLSILGVAKKLQPQFNLDDPDVVSIDRSGQSQTLPAGSRLFQPESKSAAASATAANITGPASDLRAKLQARLTSEYREALARQVKRESLREKLRKEKEVNSAITTPRGHVAVAGTGTVFSDETRGMLLARLEEEKAFIHVSPGNHHEDGNADADAEPEWYETSAFGESSGAGTRGHLNEAGNGVWDNDRPRMGVWGVADSGEQRSSPTISGQWSPQRQQNVAGRMDVTPQQAQPREQEPPETRLKRLLSERKAKQAAALELEQRSGELKQALLRNKIMKARQLKQQQQQAATAAGA